MKKVYLYGTTGAYNYGVEAIVRGTERIIRACYAECDIIYLTSRIAEDKIVFGDSSIQIQGYRYILFKRIVNRLLSYFRIPDNIRLVNIDLSWIKKADLIISIGGDVYNLLASEKYQQRKYYPNVRLKIGNYAKSLSKPFIIWGASIGPFEENYQAKKTYFEHFNKIDYITSRELNTYNYLQSNGFMRTKLFPDPAFAIESIKKESINDKKIMGINLSPLSNMYALTGQNEKNIIESTVEFLKNLINIYNTDIILLPHVVDKWNEYDDDYRYLLKIKTAVNSNRIKIIDSHPGFIGLKKEIVKCDLILSARMHCAINAITCATPTVFIGYSDKSVGMAKYVYGENYSEYYIPLSELFDSDNKIKNVVNKLKDVHSYLLTKSSELNKNAFDSMIIISKFLTE